MAWVRILIGAMWLNGAVEKFLNPEFPREFSVSLSAGGYVAQAPTCFQDFMRGTVRPTPSFSRSSSASGNWLWASRSFSTSSPLRRPSAVSS